MDYFYVEIDFSLPKHPYKGIKNVPINVQMPVKFKTQIQIPFILHVCYGTKWMLSAVSAFKRKSLIKNLILPFAHAPDESMQWINVCYM